MPAQMNLNSMNSFPIQQQQQQGLFQSQVPVQMNSNSLFSIPQQQVQYPGQQQRASQRGIFGPPVTMGQC